MNTHTLARRLGILILAAFLAACGGGSSAPPVVSPVAAITAQPTDQSVAVGTAATFSVVASNAGSYQWQRSTDGGTSFTDVSAATSASYTTALTTLASSGTKYRVVVAGAGAGNSVTSSAATLTVTAAVVVPSISVQPAAQTIIAGQNASFAVTASGTSLGYQWQRSTDGGTSFANMAGASNATLALTAVAQADNAQQFRVAVSNSGGSVTSSAALLTVNAAPVAAAFTQQPSNQSVIAPAAATFTAAASGTPAPTLQWQLDSGTGWGNIIGATSASYTTPATVVGDSGKQYRVMATNATANVTSNAASLTVSAVPVAPGFTTQPASVTITAGQSTQFTVAVSGSPAPTLQWQLSTDGGASFGNIVGATGTVFNVTNAAQANNGRQFRAVATNSAGSVNSNAAVLTVLAPVNRMLAARVDHTATPLGNGKVFVAGGVVNTSSGGFFSSTETFDPATVTWSGSASLGVARGRHTATLLANGKVLVVGGMGVNPAAAPPIRLASAELYDPAGNVWTAVASLTTARESHSATLLPNGKVLVAGGSTNNSNQLTDSAELFDPVSNTWSAAGNMVVLRQYHKSTLLPDGRVLLAGGNNNFVGSLASTELYDPSTNLWSAGTSMARARSNFSMTLLSGGKVLAVGGWDQLGIGVVASAEVYDAASNSWSAAGSLATGRYQHTATLLSNGKVLIAAGFGSTYLASAELYDPASNAWSATASLAMARYQHVATRLSTGDVLVTGGLGVSSGAAPIASAELYDLASGTWR